MSYRRVGLKERWMTILETTLTTIETTVQTMEARTPREGETRDCTRDEAMRVVRGDLLESSEPIIDKRNGAKGQCVLMQRFQIVRFSRPPPSS